MNERNFRWLHAPIPAPRECDADIDEIESDSTAIRDYFAGQALAGLCTAGTFGPDEVAERAYTIADAMLRAREA